MQTQGDQMLNNEKETRLGEKGREEQRKDDGGVS